MSHQMLTHGASIAAWYVAASAAECVQSPDGRVTTNAVERPATRMSLEHNDQGYALSQEGVLDCSALTGSDRQLLSGIDCVKCLRRMSDIFAAECDEARSGACRARIREVEATNQSTAPD